MKNRLRWKTYTYIKYIFLHRLFEANSFFSFNKICKKNRISGLFLFFSFRFGSNILQAKSEELSGLWISSMDHKGNSITLQSKAYLMSMNGKQM